MWGLFGIAIGGALGALARYGAGGLALRLFGGRLPYGTLVVNVVGSFFIGFIMELALSSLEVGRLVRFTCVIGFLGAFTTFSTFSFETIRYLEEGAYFLGLVNILLNVVLSLLAVWLGLILTRSLT